MILTKGAGLHQNSLVDRQQDRAVRAPVLSTNVHGTHEGIVAKRFHIVEMAEQMPRRDFEGTLRISPGHWLLPLPISWGQRFANRTGVSCAALIQPWGSRLYFVPPNVNFVTPETRAIGTPLKR